MRHSIFILLVLFSLSVLTFSQESIENIENEVVEIIEDGEVIPPTENPGASSFNACNPLDRPQACTKEYAPVCGYIHDCEGGACTSTFGNKCTACADENVDGYVKGACEDVQEVCDPNNRPQVCTLIYTATCAVAANCEGPHCFEDTGNPCAACGMDNVAYALPGTCPSNNRADRSYCDPNNRPEFCTLEYNPVCAHKTNCVGDTCYFTAGNRCGACGNDDVDYYLPGECSDDELGEGEDDGEGEYCEDDGEGEDWTCEDDGEDDGENGEDDTDDDNRTYCPEDRPEVCTADYRPVCAHQADCEGDDCWNTAGNACTACSDPNVDYHTPGEC